MTKRIQHIAPLQFGIVLASVYFAISLIAIPFIILFGLFGALSQHGAGPFVGMIFVAIFVPFFYAFFGFIFGIIAAAIYNLVVRWTGGIEFTLVDAPQP